MIRIGMVFGTEVKPSRDVMLDLVDAMRPRQNIALRLFHASLATTAENLAAFVATGIDGLILCDLARDTFFRFLQLYPDHPPVVPCLYTTPEKVLLDGIRPGGVVVLDNASIGRQAADFLLDRGLRNFAFLASMVRRESISGEQRCAGFESRVRAVLGEEATFSRWTMGTQMPNGDYWDPDWAEVKQWVSSLPRPCGLFVNGDREAFALTRLCRSLAIEIPAQLELLSINNAHGFCERAQPTLTSLEPDHRAFAESALKMLLALIADPALPRERCSVSISACRVVERGSTSVSRNRGKVATRAREYIRLHACEGIGVPEIVAHLGISRRLLETLMREATGRSPLELIQEIRLASCRHLLETTNLPITEVVTRSGYALTANPGRIFRKAFGMSMKAYRDAHRRGP